MGRSLLIKVTAGPEDAERCNQAFTVAAAGSASGVPVSLWLTGESVWFAVKGRAQDLGLAHAAPVSELLAPLLAAGQVTVCTQCAQRRNLSEKDLLKGAHIAGAPTFVEESLAEGVQALVY